MSRSEEIEQIIRVLAKFRADLIWDEIVGIFEKVPKSTKKAIENQYLAAVSAASQKIGISPADLESRIEDLAVELVNGQAYSPDDVRARLKEYGLEDSQN